MIVEARGIDPAGIETAGERVEDVRRPFRKASPDGVVPATFRVRNRDACSSCVNAFLLSCSRLEREPLMAADVYMGSIVEEDRAVGRDVDRVRQLLPRNRDVDLRMPWVPAVSLRVEGAH